MGLSMKQEARKIGIGYKFDNSRSTKELAIHYRPKEDTMRDHYQAWSNE